MLKSIHQSILVRWGEVLSDKSGDPPHFLSVVINNENIDSLLSF